MNAVVMNTQAAFKAIVAEVEEVLDRRDNLIVSTQAELAAMGIASVVIDQSGRHPLTTGQSVIVWRDIHKTHVNITLTRNNPVDERWGPYSFDDQWVQVATGAHTVLVSDAAKALLAAEPGPTQAQFARAIARLRRLAKSELMRVRVRGCSITLMSPMGDVVHEGDVTSAFCWLSGIGDSSLCA